MSTPSNNTRSPRNISSRKKPLRVVIMAGGTGGHVFPALSVAENLRQRGVQVSWLGTAKGIEAELVPAAGITLHCLSIAGVRGKGSLTKLRAPFQLFRAILQARRILKAEKADVVLGLGGFASGPGGVAAWLLGLPLLIHEQNAVAGTTNRWLAKLASQRLEAFPGSLPNALHVGNPVRSSIMKVAPQQKNDSDPLRLLVLGGSLGALTLNRLLPQAITLLDTSQRPEIKHQTGKRHLDVTQQAYSNANVTAELLPFVADMASVYEWADIIICRAGALTVSELTLAGRAALLVPFPYAIDDHQTRNGQWLVDHGAARLESQDKLTPEKIADFIRQVSANRQQLVEMATCARSLAMPQAASDVADCCEGAVHA